MSEGYPGDYDSTLPYMIGQVDSVTIRADGEADIGVIARTYNMSPEDVRETFADAHGISPDDVRIAAIDPETGQVKGRSRTSVGFARWNSSWDPRASNPELN